MKRLIACLLALMLPFSCAMASSFGQVLSGTAQIAEQATELAHGANGYNLSLNIAPQGAEPVTAKGFIAADETSLTFQADTPWLNPFTLRIDAEKGLLVWDGSKWYSIALEDMPAASQMMADPEQLMAALEHDMELLMPVFMPAFAPLATSPAVVMTGIKLSNMMEKGVFSLSGTDLNMVIYEVMAAFERVDVNAFNALLPQLQMGDFYAVFLDELEDMLEDLAEMEFQLKGDLHDEDKGFVTLILEDFEFTVNYHVDDKDAFVIDGTVRVNYNVAAFDLTIDDSQLTLNYSAANAQGTITAMVMPDGRAISVTGAHYNNRKHLNVTDQLQLEAMWSADLAQKDNGFILAVDVDEETRCFVDLTFEKEPETGNVTYASLSYKDAKQEHLLTLVPVGLDGFQLGYTEFYRGQQQGVLTFTATPGTVSLPALTSDITAISVEEAASLLMPAQEAPNP